MLNINRQQACTRIAGLLYDGVMSAPQWGSALDAMRQTLEAEVFHFFTLAGNDGSGAGVQGIDGVDNQSDAGIHTDKLREYEEHHVANDPRMAVVAKLPVGQVMLDHEHIGAVEMSRNAVYADVLVAQGFRNTLGIRLRDEGGARDFLGFLRLADHVPYAEEDKAFMQQLMPDLVRAAHLRARMAGLALQAALGLAALDALPQALLVVDALGRLQHANRAAERLLASSGALQSVHGRLCCTRSDLQAHWQKLLSCACASPGKAGAFAVPGSQSGQPRLVLTALPLNPCHLLARPWQQPMALVVMGVPGAMAVLDTALVGLSPCETRLLLLLSAGKTIKDYAAMEDCSWHTARTHMKNLMRKTGCHRQVELLRLLQALGMV